MPDIDQWMAAIVGPAVLTIDGPSGAGKSTLASELYARHPGWVLVRMDDVTPGWNGLGEAITRVRDELVQPLFSGEAGTWPLWSWVQERVVATRQVDRGSRLIVEGCGSTATTLESALHESVKNLWIDTPDSVRAQRLRERDGTRFAAHWPIWESNWRRYVDEFRPAERCEHVAG